MLIILRVVFIVFGYSDSKQRVVFLTGAQGQIGSEVALAFLERNYKVIAATQKTLDITDEEKVLAAITQSNADIVINTAAFTNVEKSEDEHYAAYNVNAIGARNIATACAQANLPLIHLSTDYVFSSTKEGPHKEDDDTNTECVYGHTKLEGEVFIKDSGCKHLIVRISWIFGRFGRNFVKIMLTLAKDRSDIAVVSDQFGNPTPVRPLAYALVAMTERVLDDHDFKDYGIYHYCGYDATSWDQFARAVFAQARDLKVLNHEVNVVSIPSDEFKSKAKRPSDSRLNCDKISKVFNIEPPRWNEYLVEVIESFERESQGLSSVDGYENKITLIPELNYDPILLAQEAEAQFNERQEQAKKEAEEKNNEQADQDAKQGTDSEPDSERDESQLMQVANKASDSRKLSEKKELVSDHAVQMMLMPDL